MKDECLNELEIDHINL
jgi:hypothetical protein